MRSHTLVLSLLALTACSSAAPKGEEAQVAPELTTVVLYVEGMT